MVRRLVLIAHFNLLVGFAIAEDAPPDVTSSSIDGERITVTGSSDPDVVLFYKPETTATAGFADGMILDTPFSVGVIGAELMNEQRITRIENTLKFEPAATKSYASGTYNYFNVRGNIPTTQIDGAPYWGRSRYSLEHVERVEFLRGPAALRGGFGGPGGVVNLVTKRSLATDASTVSIEGDSWGGYRGTIDSSQLFLDDRSWGTRINLAYEGLDDQWDLHGHRVFASIAQDYRLSAATTLTLDLDYLDQASVFSGEYATDINNNPVDLNPRTLYGQPWTDQTTKSLTSRAGLRQRLSETWSADIQVAAYQYREHWNATYMGPIQLTGDYDLSAYVTDENVRRGYSVTGSVHGEVTTAAVVHDVVFAAQYSLTKLNEGGGDFVLLGTSSINAPVTFARPVVTSAAPERSASKESSLVVTDEAHLTKQWSILAGGRFSSYATTNNDYETSAVVPVGALIFKPLPMITTYASYSASLEPGAVAQAPASNAGEQLSARRSNQIEIGSKADLFDQNLLVTASVFKIRADYYGYINANNLYVQDGYQDIHGAEMGTSGRVTEHVRLIAGAMYLDAVLHDTGDAVQDGGQAPFIPKGTASLSVDVEVPQIPGLGLNAGGYYTGAFTSYNYDLAALIQFDGFFTADAGARYRFRAANTPMVTRLTITNLFDRQGWEPAFYPTEPLAGKLSLEATF